MTSNKPNLLCWSDFAFAGTGFGTVSKYVIKALKDHFNIDQLAINYNGEFFDTKELPIQVSPAKLLNPQDPYGNQMFVNALQTGKYDYVWIMNDTFVVERLAKELPKILENIATTKRKVPTIIYYCPVDCQVLPHATSMLKVADYVVAYCQFGQEKILSQLPDIKDKLTIINHGVDISAFNKINPNERKLLRQQLLNVQSDDCFVWMNCNRNSLRKDLARTIAAFKEFRAQVPNSKLYLHTAIKDTTIDLGIAVNDMGLKLKEDVIFPANYAAHKPMPVAVLNALYNCADAFITTTLGEGWGLTHLEAAATGLPLVVPNNTCFPEQLDNGKRGFLYSCKETIWVDNSGYRPYGRLEDIVNTMMECYNRSTSKTLTQEATSMKEYLNTITWTRIGQQWVDLFKKIEATPKKQKLIVGTTI